MIARVREYHSYPEALTEWKRFNIAPPVEDEEEMRDLVFVFLEGDEADEVGRTESLAEELGGDAFRCDSETHARSLLVFETGMLRAQACYRSDQPGPDPIRNALQNYRRSETPSIQWDRGRLDFDRTVVMGILNVTPDSFSDGGKYLGKEAALQRALQMVEEGADIIDIGGESTRPGAEEIAPELELARILPLIRELAQSTDALISVDTRHWQVAQEALASGADIINDVSGLRQARMVDLAAETGVPVILMHMLGDPKSMQAAPYYEDVVGDISLFFQERLDVAVAAGVKRDRVVLDPGLGFGKTIEHNLEILARLREFRSLGPPILVGASRKSFIGKISGSEEGRLEGSLAAASVAILNGASIVRVHDVKETVRAVRLIDGVRGQRRPLPS
jgi:dihydropteroate synthase